MSAAFPPTAYVAAVRAALDALPGPGLRFRPADRRLVLDLYRRGVPIEAFRTALLLATLRRLVRDASLPPLAPVRSLNYYLPVVDEMLANPPDPGWVRHLAARMARLKPQLGQKPTSVPSSLVQNSAFPDEL